MNRRFKLASYLGLIATVAFVARPVDARAKPMVINTFNVLLNSGMEVPPSGTNGQGSATVTLDTVTGAVSVSGTYTNMSSNVILAHIHGPAPVGQNAGIIVTLAHTGGTSGSFSGAGVLTAGQVTAELNGLHYLNVHTSNFGGGEIRGQIATPVPAMPWGYTAALVGAALIVGVVLLRRYQTLAPRETTISV